MTGSQRGAGFLRELLLTATCLVLIIVSAWKSVWFIRTITWGMTGPEKNAAFLFGLAFAALVWILPLLTKRRGLFLVFGSVQTLWMLVGLWYFLYFHRYPPVSAAWELLGQTADLVATSSLPYYPELWISGIDLPLWLACFFLAEKEGYRIGGRSLSMIVAVFIAVSSVTGAVWWFKGYDAKRFGEDLKYYGDAVYVRRFGLGLWQLKKLAEPRPMLSYSKRNISSPGRKDRRNIVLIQVESLDAAAIRLRWNAQPVMPYLERLSRESVYYPAVMSFHKGGGTSDAELSIVNSVDPFGDRAAIMDDSLVYSNSFVRRLADSGYETMVFHGNTGKFWNRSVAFPAMGYGRFEDTFTMPLRQEGWGVPDHLVFGYVRERLAAALESGRNVFCHIITMSTHEPYNLTSRYFTNREFDRVPDARTRRFYSSLSYLDRSLADFVPRLLEMPGTDVFLIGDHAAIEMSGFDCSRVPVESSLLDFVPLMMVSSDGQKPREVRLAGSFLDLAVTFLNASGVPFKILSDGEDLLDTPAPESLVSQDGRNWDRRELFHLWSGRTRRE